jgi:hypothetical protein
LIRRIPGGWQALIIGAAGATFGLGLSRALTETLCLPFSWLASWPGVGLAAAGIVALIRRAWRVALVTLALWVPYTFYALSYYVPDLAVFMIPAHLVMAVWMGFGAWAVVRLVGRWLHQEGTALSLGAVLLALLPVSLVIQHGSAVDRSAPNPLEPWGRHPCR